jgi:prophage DNA circulation protein
MVSLVSLPSILLDASIGGIPFLYVDADDQPGRRVLRFLYPGSDTPDFQDIGREDGPLRISGMVIGDDWITQANALRDLFATPGPYTLVHPWLGTFLVMPAEKPKFSDSQSAARQTKFDLSLWRYYPAPTMATSTYAELVADLEDLRTAVDDMLDVVLDTANLISSTISQAAVFVSDMVDWVTSAALAGLSSIVAVGLSTLDAVVSLGASASYAASMAAALVAPFVELAEASNPSEPAAIGPGTAAATTTPTDGRLTAGAMLSIAAAAAAQTNTATPAPALAIAVQAYALSYACSAASDIDYTDSTEATTWRDNIASALDTASAAAGTAAAATTTDDATAMALGVLWQALLTARQAWFADMNDVIGRLPVVETLTLPGNRVSIWLVAQYVAQDFNGNNVTSVVSTVGTLISRNALYSPALTAGSVEVLSS